MGWDGRDGKRGANIDIEDELWGSVLCTSQLSYYVLILTLKNNGALLQNPLTLRHNGQLHCNFKNNVSLMLRERKAVDRVEVPIEY